MFALPAIYNGVNFFVVRRALSADEIAERILYSPMPEHPNCRCVPIKKDDEK